MARVLALTLCLSSAAAFAPAARSASRVAPRMAEEVSRRELGQAIAAAIGSVGFASAAGAKAGESPKFSVFGVGADIDTVSEGAFYNMDLNRPTYSPYSPFAPTGTGVYKKANAEEIAFQKQMFANTKKEIVKSEAFIAAKKWEEVRSLYERRMYNMRNSMNYLAANASKDPKVSAKAAKKFYASMEDTGLKSKRKQQAAAKVAYVKMMEDLGKFESTL